MTKFPPLLALALLGACTVHRPLSAAQTPESAVVARVEALAQAFERGDAEGVVSFVSPEMHLIHPRRGEVNAADFITSVRRGVRPDPARRLTVSTDHVAVAGDLAVINLTWRTTHEGQSAVRLERDLEVWRRENGEWRLFRGASFPVEQGR